jgi:hypothetical protein
MAIAIYCDLSLFHCFQQSSLCLGRRAVNFVSQQDVGEHWTLAQVETRSRDIKNVGAGYV